MWRILIGLLSIAFVHAEERTPEDWAKELNTAYLNNGGYIATYSSKNSKGALDITLGFHPISGISAAFADLKTDQSMKVWFWTVGDDAVLMRKDNGELAATGVVRGMKSTIQAMARIEDTINTDQEKRGSASSDIIMVGMLEKNLFSVGPLARSRSASPWETDIKGGVITVSDADTVTVRTENRGDLVFSRKHGMLLSQAFPPTTEGAVRALRLQQLHLAPAKEAVEKLFEGQDGKAVVDINFGSIVGPHVFGVLENIIRNTDRGFTDISLLEEACGKEADTLRSFAYQCVGQSEDLWPTAEDWKKLLATTKEFLRKEWLKNLPEGVKPDEKDFEIYLARADIREEFRKIVAEGLVARNGAATIAMHELFKKQLVAETESGKAAKRILESALTKAYLEALTDKKLKTFWSEREGLD